MQGDSARFLQHGDGNERQCARSRDIAGNIEAIVIPREQPGRHDGRKRFEAGALMVNDADLSSAWIAANALPLLRDAGRLGQMSRVAAEHGRPDAAGALAELVLSAAS